MFENIIRFLKKLVKSNDDNTQNSKNAAKERLHLVLIQDRASVSADFLEVMKQEIIEVIKKYIDIDESAIDVRLTNNTKDDGTVGAPALYANFPITNVKIKGPEIESNAKQENAVGKHIEGSENEGNGNEDKEEKSIEGKNKEEEQISTNNQPEIEISAEMLQGNSKLVTDSKGKENDIIEKAANKIIETNN